MDLPRRKRARGRERLRGCQASKIASETRSRWRRRWYARTRSASVVLERIKLRGDLARGKHPRPRVDSETRACEIARDTLRNPFKERAGRGKREKRESVRARNLKNEGRNDIRGERTFLSLLTARPVRLYRRRQMARRKNEQSAECLTQTRASSRTRIRSILYGGAVNVTPCARHSRRRDRKRERERESRITRDLPNTPSDILPRAVGKYQDSV